MDIRFSERAKQMRPSAIRNKLFDLPGIISFSAGKPEASLFPERELQPLIQDILQKNGLTALQYGSTEGLAPLREIIANRLMKARGVDTTPDHITLTSGSQEGIELSAKLFVNEGDVIIVERPSYTGAFSAFQGYGPRYVSVPMDENGMRMDALEEALKQNPDAGMIYTIPDFQNPTGVTLSIDRRKRMAELAAEYRVPVIEDCPYSDLIFEGEPLPAVKSYDKEGYVITLGTFSKTFSPGVRIGWICADEEILQKYALSKQGMNLQCGTLDQHVTLSYLQNHDLSAHVKDIRDLYRTRRDLVLRCIEDYFPKNIRCTKPNGGFFVWMELPATVDTGALLLEAAEKAGVVFVPGASFFADGEPRNFLRLSYSSVGEADILEGMKRLGGLIREKCG